VGERAVNQGHPDKDVHCGQRRATCLAHIVASAEQRVWHTLWPAHSNVSSTHCGQRTATCLAHIVASAQQRV
jgi:hypothetical protein